jgi:hypothetical protein
MDDSLILKKLSYVARETAASILNEDGLILPFTITLSADGNHAQSMTAADTHPDATLVELLGLSVEYLRTVASTGAISGVALITPMESGPKVGFLIQLETRSESVVYLYQYHATPVGWTIDEPVRGDTLFVPEGFF